MSYFRNRVLRMSLQNLHRSKPISISKQDGQMPLDLRTLSVRAAKDAFADTFRRELDTGAESSEEIALTMGMLSSLTMREQLLATHKLERAGDADKLAPRTLESRRYADVAMLGELAVSPRLTESQSKLVLDAIDKQVALVKDSDPEAYAKKTSLQSGRMYVQQQTASSYQPKHAR